MLNEICDEYCKREPYRTFVREVVVREMEKREMEKREMERKEEEKQRTGDRQGDRDEADCRSDHWNMGRGFTNEGYSGSSSDNISRDNEPCLLDRLKKASREIKVEK
jgi:hypothetical protein